MIESSIPPFLGIDRIWKPKASIFRGDLPGTHAHTNTREISRMERYRLGRGEGAPLVWLGAMLLSAASISPFDLR